MMTAHVIGELLKDLKSGPMKHARYEADARIVSVWSQNDTVWNFMNVEPEAWETFTKNPSAAEFFHSIIVPYDALRIKRGKGVN